MSHRIALVLAGLAAAALLSGCVGAPTLGVRPWERDALARPDMAWDPDPLEATLQGHIYFSKEAAMPGGAAGGGGCGCN
jgi:hypothetical protein